MGPPFDPLFESAWQKWFWAVRHALALEAEVKRFANDPQGQPSIPVRAEYNPKRHAFDLLIDSVPEIPWTWDLLVGDIASNFRSCLDHIGWAIVTRGRTPPATLTEGEQSRVYFPISNNPAHLRSQLKQDRTGRRPGPRKNGLGMLPGAALADLALIRRYQPYHVPGGEKMVPFQCLSILNAFVKVDKHREVQPTLAVPTLGYCEATEVSDCVFTETRTKARTIPIKPNARIGSVRVRKTGPNPQMKVNVGLTVQICLGNTVPIITWTDTTTNWIGALLKDLSEPPPYLQ